MAVADFNHFWLWLAGRASTEGGTSDLHEGAKHPTVVGAKFPFLPQLPSQA